MEKIKHQFKEGDDPQNSWYILFLLKIFLKSKTLMLDEYWGKYLVLKTYLRQLGKKKSYFHLK